MASETGPRPHDKQIIIFVSNLIFLVLARPKANAPAASSIFAGARPARRGEGRDGRVYFYLKSASRYAMSRSIIALSVFHLSDRTVMKPYLICFGATAMATLDLPVIESRKCVVKQAPNNPRNIVVFIKICVVTVVY